MQENNNGCFFSEHSVLLCLNWRIIVHTYTRRRMASDVKVKVEHMHVFYLNLKQFVIVSMSISMSNRDLYSTITQSP